MDMFVNEIMKIVVIINSVLDVTVILSRLNDAVFKSYIKDTWK